MIDQNNLSIAERITAPTPKLFATIRNIGIILAALSGAVIAVREQGIPLPEIVTVLSEKAAWISGLIAAIISQLTVDFKKLSGQAIINSVDSLDKKKR